MSIRVKTLLALGLIVLALLAANQYVTLVSLQRHVTHAERLDLLARTADLDDAVREYATEMARRVDTLASRDETYEFAARPSREFVADTFSPATMENLGVSALALMDRSGKRLCAAGFDVAKGQVVPVPKELIEHLGPDHPLLTKAQARSGESGLLACGDDVMVVCAFPILDGRGEGPSRGTLVAGRLIDNEVLAELSRLTEVPIDVRSLIARKIPDEFQSASADLRKKGDRTIQRLGENLAAAYIVEEDLHGVPIAVRGYFTRDIYQQGLVTQRFLTLMLLVVGACFAVGTLLLIGRIVLVPVAHLVREVAKIERERNPGMRLEVRGKDELAHLGHAINDMLASLDLALEREQHLQEEVAQLRIEIDQSKVHRQASEVAETDFFKELQARAQEMRQQYRSQTRRQAVPDLE